MPVSTQRFVALDAFRGATVAAMLLVNNPGSWSHVYAPLRHAEWHGWTPTDLIFPFFLFVVGMTTHLAIERRLEAGGEAGVLAARVARRGALIVLLGLVLGAFPFVALGSIPEVPDPTLLDRMAHRFDTLRVPGVLQRIGVVYAFVGLWVLARPRSDRRNLISRSDALLLAAILGSYWILLTLVLVPGTGTPGWNVLDQPGETLAAWSDRAVFGVRHLWSQSKTWDPEGVLSTLPAIATALMGLAAGRWLASGGSLGRRVRGFVLAGACLTGGGLLWGIVFPINKNLWTSSYVVFTAGMAMLCLAASLWLIDVKGFTRLASPAVAFGVNPMLAFFGSGIMARLITSVIKVPFEGRSVPLQRALHEVLFASWLPDKPASLAYATAFVLVWLAILWPLWKRGVIWKV